MASKLGKRRAVVVAGAVLALSCLAGARLAAPAFAADTAPKPAPKSQFVPGTFCQKGVGVRGCVDLTSQKAFLINNDKVVRGPVSIASGGNGQATPTNLSFRVYRKDQNHKSQESKLANGQPAPMPWSVFFADGGIAFHSGSPNRASAGCVHLGAADAQAFFNFLQVGDKVQVVDGAKGDDHHGGDGTNPNSPGTNKSEGHSSSGDDDSSSDHGDHSDSDDDSDDGGNED